MSYSNEKSAEAPQKLSKDRMARWEQQSEAQTPPRPGKGAPEIGRRKPSPLPKSPENRRRENRVFLRETMKVELPQPQAVTAAIAEALIESEPEPGPVAQPSLAPLEGQNRPRNLGERKPRPPLERRDRQADMSGVAKQALTELRDEAKAKVDASAAAFDVAKTLKVSELRKQGGLTDLKATVDEAVKTTDSFLKTGRLDDKPNTGRPGGRTDKRSPFLRGLQDEVETMAAEPRLQSRAIADLIADDKPGPDDLVQSIEAKKRGIRFTDLKLAEFGDDKLDRAKSQEDFAGGVVNKVSKLVYGNETRIFKEEKLTTNSRANQIGIAGIDKTAPRFGNRNVATKVMSNLLGGNVIPDSCYTIHDGKLGLLMQEAPGMEVRDFKESGAKLKPEMAASLHSQLNELEWTDMLSGQGDRHDKNYMIDVKNDSLKISGIDNDFCFGENQTEYKKYGSEKINRGARRGPYWGYNSAEKPTLIDQKSYKAITETDFEKHVRPKLVGLLTQPEIDASESRFKEMQDHARSLSPAYVVTDWANWTSPDGLSASEFLTKDGAPVSMFQRDFKDMV